MNLYQLCVTCFADDDYPDAAAGVPVDRKIDPLDMTFLNHEAAFKSKSTMQVLRGYVVYQLCSIGFLVENNETVNALALITLSTYKRTIDSFACPNEI